MRSGESIRKILHYWWPELISTAVFIYLPPLIDAQLIAHLQSTTTFGALGMTSNFLHMFIKLAEAIPAATMAIVGKHNGAKEYKKCGQDMSDAFWTTFIMGAFLFLFFFFSAEHIYRWLGVPEKMVAIGVPFLRLRALGILLIFILYSFIGFMKGIKNTYTPMIINIIGLIVFVTLDYLLILGKHGFPKMGLTGSAIATIAQYTSMICIAIWYIATNTDYKKYFSTTLLTILTKKGTKRLFSLSLPIMIDKASLSFSYVWLSKMLAPMGKYIIAAMKTVQDLERIAFLPALAFAQIITFLVSNRLGAQDVTGAQSNIKKVVLLSLFMVSILLTILCYKAPHFISFFDLKNKFTSLATPTLIIVSTLVIFDLVQVILAGALRGAGDVKTVMYGRAFISLVIFVPVTYWISHLPISNITTKFTLMYSTFYITNGLMGIFFFTRLTGSKWYQQLK